MRSVERNHRRRLVLAGVCPAQGTHLHLDDHLCWPRRLWLSDILNPHISWSGIHRCFHRLAPFPLPDSQSTSSSGACFPLPPADLNTSPPILPLPLPARFPTSCSLNLNP